MNIEVCGLYALGICCGSLVLMAMIYAIAGVIKAFLQIFHKQPVYRNCNIVKKGK
jgi:hypothetical protein